MLSCTGALSSTLGAQNPFRYRGYVYDTETGLYYLQSRYYDPEVGRFINIDSVIVDVGNTVKGYNIFIYCNNNPINMNDAAGCWPKWIKSIASWVDKKIIQPTKNYYNPNTNTTSGQFTNGIFTGSGSLTGGFCEGNSRLQVNSQNSNTSEMLGIFGKASVGNASGKIGIGNKNATISLKGVGDGLTVSGQLGAQYKGGLGFAAKAKGAVLSGRITIELNTPSGQIEFGVTGDLLTAGAEATIGFFPDEGFTAKVGYGAGWYGVGYVFRIKPNQ